MSVKHVRDYYNQVVANYTELKEDLKDLEDLAKDHQISPEQVEQMKSIMAPVKQNYETLSYFIYLLNQPNKKVKQATYKKQNENLLKAGNKRTQADILIENKKALTELKDLKEEVSES